MAFCYSLLNSNKNIYSLIRKTINRQREKCETIIFKKSWLYLTVIVCCFVVVFFLKKGIHEMYWIASAEA